MSKVIAENQENEGMRNPQRKRVERLVVAIAVVGTLVLISVFGNITDKLNALLNPNSNVYGVWVEQNVPSYSAERILLNQYGVTIKGRVVATHFRFNGSEISYTFGNRTLRYKMKDHTNTEMKLVSEPYYQPVFQLSEKHKNGDE